MLRIIGIAVLVVVVAVAGLLIYAATRPDDFRVERSIAVKAPPDKVMALVGDLRGWTAWSPYEKKDPGMKRSYSGAPAGKGAIYEWDGNNQVGRGRMEILEATPSLRTTPCAARPRACRGPARPPANRMATSLPCKRGAKTPRSST